jgi:4-cresol dehydrogenase (hydroxylating)
MGSKLDSALKAWSRQLGAENIDTDAPACAQAGRSTFSEPHEGVIAVLRPKGRGDVKACVEIAGKHGIALYPISRGRNWGYGSAAPAAGSCAVLDLRRLDAISDYDARLGSVSVGPGVTQQALSQFLESNGDQHWIDATGTTVDSSILGNALDRGNGYSPYAEHCVHICALEAVLADGSTITTGFGAFGEKARAANAYKWGVGPSLDSLFFQSNLAIITRATIWLLPKPEYFQAFFFSVKHDDDIGDVVDALTPLRLAGLLNSAVHIGNVYRVISTMQQYPFGEQSTVPIEPARIETFKKEAGVEAWSGTGALYGTKAQVTEARKRLKRALKGKVSRLQFLDDRMLAIARRIAPLYRMATGIDLQRILGLLKPVYGIMQGRPSSAVIGSVYWRKRMSVPEQGNPDRDACGLIWCPLISPAKGEVVAQAVEIASQLLLERGFEPGITVTHLTERAIDVVISITYDRETEGEDERAKAAYLELLERLGAEGFYPYRLATLGMGVMDGMSTETRAVLTKLKQAFDPKGLISPGRYLR